MAQTAPQFADDAAQWTGPEGMLVQPATAQILQARGLKAFFAYWTARAAGHFAPRRAHIEPRDMASLLPHLHLYDVIEGGISFRLRVMGTALVAAIGADQTGRILTDTDQDLPARRAMAAMRDVVAGKIGVRTSASRVAATKPSVLAVESLWLPLSEDGVTVSQILGCSIMSEPQDLRPGFNQ